MKDEKLKDREVKTKREIVSIDDMDKFKQKETKKIRPIKNIWYNWLNNYIPGLIRRGEGSLKDVRIFKIKNTSKETIIYGRGKKLGKPKTQKL